MAIQIADNFSYQGKKPLDGRTEYNTIAAMVAVSESALNDGCLAYVKANKKYYTFDSTNDTDVTLGKWRELQTGATGDFIPTSEKGANGGVAELDSSGKVPASQLPSYVDDVKSYPTKNDFPAVGEDDKIYIAKDENASYRWDGEDYVSISSANGLTLGETSSTAYRGDRGKIAYDDSQANKTAIGTLANLTTTEKTNLVGAINEIDNALGGKVDAVQGKGLSENDYSDTDKAIVDGVTNALADKVDKVSGKGLSTNDYDNTEKQKVADAQPKTLATPITVEGVQQTTVEGALGAINNKSGGGGDVSSKADKVTNATAGNFAGLDATGNLTDSGKKASDFLTQHQDISGKQDVELETPITIGGEEQDTVEEALGALNGAKEDIFRASIMPLATLDDEGKVLQYIGTSIPDSYQHNYFYECKAQGTEPETYAWEQVNVQPTSEGDARVKPEITEIGVRIQDGCRPYIKVDLASIIPAFEDASLDDIATIADLYYNGDLTLEEIQDVWKLGDSRTFTLSSMSAETVRETHAQQTCTMKIVDFNHDVLTTPINEREKAFLTFAFMISESGSMKNSGSDSGGSSTGNTGGWQSSERRTWCNNTCVNALPLEIQNLLKAVDKTYDIGGASQTTAVTSDKLFIPSAIELTNGAADSEWNTSNWTSIRAGGGGGTQYEYYKTHNLPISKNICTSTTVGAHSSSSGIDYYNSYWVGATSSKERYHFRGDSAQGLLIHGCI